MSGGWNAGAPDDHATITNNTFIRNNCLQQRSFSGGLHVSTANEVVAEGNTFQGNCVAGINIIFYGSRNPPQPDSRGVVIRNNKMNGDPTVGCSLAAVSCSGNS